ncbi:hypothetical protein SAMN05518672_115126 [Chitinophaga sp. CF118]|nr:hypothetical protein SAMN05518672_115126 [Chitinophaga sp. CF118]
MLAGINPDKPHKELFQKKYFVLTFYKHEDSKIFQIIALMIPVELYTYYKFHLVFKHVQGTIAVLEHWFPIIFGSGKERFFSSS